MFWSTHSVHKLLYKYIFIVIVRACFVITNTLQTLRFLEIYLCVNEFKIVTKSSLIIFFFGIYE